LFSQMTEHD